MRRNLSGLLVRAESDEVEEGEYKDPHQVHKVPIQSNLFYHFIVLTAFKHPTISHNENDQIDDDSRKHVESVESRNKEEEVGIRLLDSVFIVVHVGSKRETLGASVPQFQSVFSADVHLVGDVFVQR